eukprot:4244149-Amphidinium_carterae.1
MNSNFNLYLLDLEILSIALRIMWDTIFKIYCAEDISADSKNEMSVEAVSLSSLPPLFSYDCATIPSSPEEELVLRDPATRLDARPVLHPC